MIATISAMAITASSQPSPSSPGQTRSSAVFFMSWSPNRKGRPSGRPGRPLFLCEVELVIDHQVGRILRPAVLEVEDRLGDALGPGIALGLGLRRRIGRPL